MKEFDKLIAVAQGIRNEAIKEYEEEIEELKNEIYALKNFKNEKIGYEKEIEELKKSNNALKEKYNNNVQNIGLDYHLEATRIDYGVAVFCIIKRDDIYAKKFIFRFRKNPQIGLDLSRLSSVGNPLPELSDEEKKEIRKEKFNKNFGSNENEKV